MEINNEFKARVIEAISATRCNYDSDAKHAKVLGITASVYANIKQGKTEGQLSDANWLKLARLLNVTTEWITGETPTYIHITSQLSNCQRSSIGSIFCDVAGIGKTHAARAYASSHKNAVCVDCSQVIAPQDIIRLIARSFGLDYKGRFKDVYELLVRYLQGVHKPLIILDEAGDLENTAFRLVKKLWNATEKQCGWYLLGADGLKERWERARRCRTVGYAEMFNRFGETYQSVVPLDPDEKKAFHLAQVKIVATLNTPAGLDVKRVIAGAKNLRRIPTEIAKQTYELNQE